MNTFSDIFNWENVDYATNTNMFDTCNLLRDVGPYSKGDFFESIFFDTEKLTLTFYKTTLELDSGEPCMTKQLGLVD